MRYIRLLLFSAIFLFVVVTGISLLIPSNVRVSRAVNMQATPSAISRYVDDMREWHTWNPFFSGEGKGGNVNFIDTAGGKDAAMEIDGTIIRWKKKTPQQKIASLEKKGFRPIENGWNIISHEGSDSTTVQWYLDFRLRWYPWEKFSSLLFEKNYGTRMEQGLTNLKKLVQGTAGQ